VRPDEFPTLIAIIKVRCEPGPFFNIFLSINNSLLAENTPRQEGRGVFGIEIFHGVGINSALRF